MQKSGQNLKAAMARWSRRILLWTTNGMAIGQALLAPSGDVRLLSVLHLQFSSCIDLL